jgi:hypothetical protein
MTYWGLFRRGTSQIERKFDSGLRKSQVIRISSKAATMHSTAAIRNGQTGPPRNSKYKDEPIAAAAIFTAQV